MIWKGMKTESLFKNFMLVQVSHLPIVGEEGILLGFLSKEKLQIEMADLSRESLEFEKIPDEFIEYDLPDSLLVFFHYQSKIPVISIFGKRHELWDKAKLLAEYSRSISHQENESKDRNSSEENNPFFESEKINIPNRTKDPTSSTPRSSITGGEEVLTPAKKDPVSWLMKLILESFADPLLSTDINGNAVFFNDRFESEILAHNSFRNSVSFAERYFRDLNKDVFAAFLKANEMDMNLTQDNGRVLQTILSKIGYLVRIVTLSHEEKVVGYLYHFTELKAKMGNEGDSPFSFPSLDEAFANKIPLDIVLRETESFYIYQSLIRNHNNVSHTAMELEIPRSTLQNRMKQLDLEKKFSTGEKAPIPRKRKKNKKETLVIEKEPDLKKSEVKKNSETSKKVAATKKSAKENNHSGTSLIASKKSAKKTAKTKTEIGAKKQPSKSNPKSSVKTSSSPSVKTSPSVKPITESSPKSPRKPSAKSTKKKSVPSKKKSTKAVFNDSKKSSKKTTG